MAPSSTKVLLVLPFFVLLFGVQWGQCVRVEFYAKKHYEDLVEERNLTPTEDGQCINLQSQDNHIKSVKTDTCLILYGTKNCERPSLTYHSFDEYFFNYRVDGNTPNTNKTQFVNSFHVCGKRGGGPLLDFDISNVVSMESDGKPISKEYRDVCGCRNVPSELNGGKSFRIVINNHGNSVNVYAGQNCQGESKYLPAGEDFESLGFNKLPFDVKSFEPANLDNCYKLSAKISKFQFRNGTQSIEDLATDKISLGAESEVKNSSPYAVTQIFNVRSRITDTVKFGIAEPFTKMDSAGVEAGFKVTAESGVPLISNKEVQKKLTANYYWTQNDSGYIPITISQERAIAIHQKIKIPGCMVCEITPFVKKVLDFPINYTASAKVSAAENTEPLSAEELRRSLPPGMEYVKIVDQHTIEAATEGSMNVDFGLVALIDVDCRYIPNCVPANDGQSLPNHQVIESPIIDIESDSGSSSNSDYLKFLKNAFYLFMKHF